MHKWCATQFLNVFMALMFLFSCSKKDQPNNPVGINLQQEDVVNDEGLFKAKIIPLNSFYDQKPSGEFEIFIDQENFKVKGQMKGVDPAVKHFQVIHERDKCPDVGDDKNQDGVIDLSELIKISGKKLLPLDSNLISQIEGMDYGPVGDDFGEYVYKKSISLELLFDDLYFEDDNYFDELMKLNFGEKLNLKKRVLVIYGTEQDLELPIACGSFTPMI